MDVVKLMYLSLEPCLVRRSLYIAAQTVLLENSDVNGLETENVHAYRSRPLPVMLWYGRLDLENTPGYDHSTDSILNHK